MQDRVSRMLDSLLSLTRTGFILLVGIEAVSLYLLQRGVISLSRGRRALPSTTDWQVDYFGLEFSYQTMTLVWPVVLGLLCLACAYVMRKSVSVWSELVGDKGGFSADDVAKMVPFLLTPARFGMSAHRAFWVVLGGLPFAALAIHVIGAIGFSGLSMTSRIKTQFFASELMFGLVVAVVTSTFGVWSARVFLRHLLKMRSVIDDTGVDA